MSRFVRRHVCLLIALALVAVGTRQASAESIVTLPTPLEINAQANNGGLHVAPLGLSKIAVIEGMDNLGPPYSPQGIVPFGGWVRGSHHAFQHNGESLVTERRNKTTVDGTDSNHATSVASRLFPSTIGTNGGHADPDHWRVISYQTDSPDQVEAAINEVSPEARIINMSFGLKGDSVMVPATDKAAFQARNLFTVSAGNDGEAGKIRPPGTAFNVVTVGATNQAIESVVQHGLPRVSSTPASVNVAEFSSRGRVDIGRSKPDLVAPGQEVSVAAAYDDSVVDDQAIPSNDNTLIASGTSLAAPYVAGVAAHLIDARNTKTWNTKGTMIAHETDPMVVKAVLLNSAQEVTGDTWDGWRHDKVVQQTLMPLDKDQGAGEVSLSRAEQQYVDVDEQEPANYVELIGWDYGTISPNTYMNYVWKQKLGLGSVVQATLDWFREFDGAGKPLLLDDLDLELWRFDGLKPVLKRTWSNSGIDNVEHIHRFEITEKGYYGLRVNFLGNQTKNGDDKYGLAWFTYAVPEPVPEPSTYLLAVLGGVVLLFRTRRSGRAAVKRA
jgi:hypothetical protein